MVMCWEFDLRIELSVAQSQGPIFDPWKVKTTPSKITQSLPKKA